MSTLFELFDTLQEPCFILNRDLSVFYCNETAALLCGVTTRKARRMKFTDLMTFDSPVEWLNDLTLVVDPSPYRELRFHTPEGGEGRLQISARPWPSEDGNPRWLIYVRDVTLEERLQKKYRAELEQKEGYITELEKARAALEDYSRNLEQKVEERTREIQQLSRLQTALLDSLGQGFFVFGADGKCLDFSSKACERILEGRPNGRWVWDVLKIEPAKVEGFRRWLTTLFGELLPFDDLVPLGPSQFPHSDGSHIRLEYYPLRGTASIDGVVVVASDITSLLEAQRQAESERSHALFILNLVQKRQALGRFCRETERQLNELREQISTEDIEFAFRVFHTIKGGAATFSIASLAEAAHLGEESLNRWRETRASADSAELTRVARQLRERFTEFLAQAREIMGPAAFAAGQITEVPLNEIREICEALDKMPGGSTVANRLREKYLMEPAGGLLDAYDGMIQRLAADMGKQLTPLKINGAEVKLPADAYGALFATLVHAFRNAVDHGIETPEQRQTAGKSPAGTIIVDIERTRQNLRIQIRDDGGGISPARIRERLRSRGVNTDDETDDEVIQHIFDPSFSTRDQVTAVSGRGVGMDAIREAAVELGGSCWVRSQVGAGTLLVIEVPWPTTDLKAA